MTAHKPIADPINLYDARNEDHSELSVGAAIGEWVAPFVGKVIIGVCALYALKLAVVG